MKKRSAKKETKIKCLFNKMGMTYVELICALALLSLVVVMFTPMLLSSYETLYIAGEKVEEVYDSKVEIEGGLASRSSISIANIGMTFKMNSEKLFENMNVAGRRITSHFQSELETVFHGARARVDLLTPDVIYDDTSWHDVILQTTGLDWESGDVILFNLNENRNKNLETLKENLTPGQILIDVIKPNKQTGSSGTSTDSLVYDNGDRATIKDGIFNVDPVKKRISFRFDGADFTNSPLKICVYYVNERGVLKSLSDYLYIKPAHIIFAGKGTSDYFTSAGIEKVDISTGDEEEAEHTTIYQLTIEGRAMQLTNSKLLSNGPQSSGVTINTVQWIDNDEQKGFDPYYVMAGTNGSVYRMYNINTETDLKTLLGAQNNIDATKDSRYNIDTGETIFPSYWSGEMSDQYNFQTAEEAAGYGATHDNKTDCTGVTAKNAIGTRYNYFDTTLRYMMMFSGYTTSYKYQQQASKRISYILTEARDGKSFRLAGKKNAAGDFAGHTGIWEPSPLVTPGGTFEFYALSNSKEVRDWVPVYLYQGNGTDEEHFDKNFAYLQLKSYTSINPFSISKDSSEYKDNFNKGDFWYPNSSDGSYDKENNLHNKRPNMDQRWLEKDYAKNINVTSAAYLPGAGSNGQGQVVYFGYVPAYAYIRQSSDIGKGPSDKNGEDGRVVYNTKDSKESRATVYVVCGNDGVGTTIYKGYKKDQNDAIFASNLIQAAGYKDVDNIPDNDTPDAADYPDAFFRLTTVGSDDLVYKFTDTNLTFTLGYCSRWRMVIGEVTSNGVTEETRSYEKYHINSYCLLDPKNYYNTFPADASGNQAINSAGPQNLYYHVWFPGEFYNLTETATLDEVTVAVGYTVSGSTYMKETSGLAAESGMYGTALGSVYNDGVLAAYTSSGNQYNLDASKGGKTTIFQNLLYYKAHDFIQRYNSETNSYSSEQHARENTRFVKVGLAAETTSNKDSNGNNTGSGIKKYFAYYADNKANIYRSLVATAEVNFNASSDSAEENVELVDVIKSYPVIDAGTAYPIEGVEKPIYGMQPIYLTNYDLQLSSIFSEITAIESYDDIIVITGTPQTVEAGNAFGGPYNGVVVGIRDANNNWTWKVHSMQFSDGAHLMGSTLDSAKIIGGYLYLSGYGNINQDGKNNCWVGAINLEALKALKDGDPFAIAGYNTSSTDNSFMWQNLGDSNRIYAIDGYATN